MPTSPSSFVLCSLLMAEAEEEQPEVAAEVTAEGTDLVLASQSGRASQVEASQVEASQLAPSQMEPAEFDDRLGLFYQPGSAASSAMTDPIVQVLERLQACSTLADLGEILEPKQLFLECETDQKLYSSLYACLERTVASDNDVVAVGEDPQFDVSLQAPAPFIVALQTICGSQGWSLEAALQGWRAGLQIWSVLGPKYSRNSVGT